MSGGEIGVDLITALVRQLKAKFFDIHFFKAMEDDIPSSMKVNNY